MTDTEHIGQLLKRLREERGLSKKRLARESLVSDAYLVQIEQGKRTPSEKVLRRLATSLQVPPWELLIPAGTYSPETVAAAHAMRELSLNGRDLSGVTQAEADMGFGAMLEDASGSPLADTEYLLRQKHPDVFESPEFYQAAPEGWTELSRKDKRLIQLMINRMRYVDTEDE